MLSVKQGSIKHNFWVFSMIRPRIEPQETGLLVNTLPTKPMGRLNEGFYPVF